MKLKKDLNKEDLHGHSFVLTTGSEESKQIQDLLRQLGFRLQNGYGYLEDFLKEDFHTYLITLDGLIHWSCGLGMVGSNQLSDLIEEEYPEYVRWIGASKKGFINGGVYKTEPDTFLGDCLMIKNGNKIFGSQCNYSFPKSMKGEDNVEHATKEEYDAQNTYTGYATEAQAELNKEWEEQHPVKEKYEISIEHIGELYMCCVKGELDTVEKKLKEWFPNASIFKEKEERTYKIRDKFFLLSNMVQHTLIRIPNGKVTIVSDETGWCYIDRWIAVEDITRIRKEELNELVEDFFKRFATV